MDNLTPAERSEIMSRVKSRNTRPEILVRSFLHRHGLRFRINQPALPGKPDIILSKYQAVIFVNGCFWHCHQDPNCKLARMPKSNVEFWRDKLSKNIERDKLWREKLESLGWRVFYVWECQLAHPESLLLNLIAKIKSM
jgi:DNA mismatch endonuclease (patch repair protein)